MGGAIKGITIEFAGNATKLQKTIRDIDSALAKTDAELSKVKNALKFNPTSVDLWRQKQQLLKDKIGETEKKLDALKTAQKQMDAAGVDKNSEQYRKLQREIITTESKLKNFKKQLNAIGSPRLQALGEQFKAVGSKIEGAGNKLRGLSTAAAAAEAAIAGVTVKSAKWADDINTMSKQYSIGTKELQKYSAAAQLVDVDVETIAKSQVKLTKSMAKAEKGTGNQAEAFDKLGVSVTDADGNLRDADDVFDDVIAALGDVENETERNALAMDLFGKSASELNPLIEDGGEAYEKLADTLAKYDLDFIDQETLDRANDFNDELDTIKAIGLVAFQNIGTQLAGYLAPALEKVVEYVGRFAKWLSNLDPKLLAIIAAVAGFVAALAPLLIVIGKISQGVGAFIKILGLLTGPVGLVILAIAALIAIGVLLYKNWDKIKAKALELKTKVVTTFNNLKQSVVTTWNNIKTAVTTAVTNMASAVRTKIDSLKSSVASKFQAIKTAITDPISKAKETIKGIIDKIKGLFPLSVGKIFSNIKLPKIQITKGEAPWGIAGKGTAPTIGLDWVNWYAKGGIFNSPTIAGVGDVRGGEAVVPLDKFWDKMDQMQAGSNIVININGANKDPREIAEEVKRMLIKETNQSRQAWQ